MAHQPNLSEYPGCQLRVPAPRRKDKDPPFIWDYGVRAHGDILFVECAVFHVDGDLLGRFLIGGAEGQPEVPDALLHLNAVGIALAVLGCAHQNNVRL